MPPLSIGRDEGGDALKAVDRVRTPEDKPAINMVAPLTARIPEHYLRPKVGHLDGAEPEGGPSGKGCFATAQFH